MHVVLTTNDQATLELSYDELVLLYGGLAEACEALSPSEFHARVGRAEADAEALRLALKPVVLALQESHQRADTG